MAPLVEWWVTVVSILTILSHSAAGGLCPDGNAVTWMAVAEKPGAHILKTRWLVRAPIALFRAGFGFLFGGRLMMLEHVGRTSGEPRYIVLEVLTRPNSNEMVIASGLGRQSQWFQNIVANPNCHLSIGARRVLATAAVLPVAGAALAIVMPASTTVEVCRHRSFPSRPTACCSGRSPRMMPNATSPTAASPRRFATCTATRRHTSGPSSLPRNPRGSTSPRTVTSSPSRIQPRDASEPAGEVILKLVSSSARQLVSTAAQQAELGYSLHPDAVGSGYLIDAARVMLTLGFGHYGFHRIFALLAISSDQCAGSCSMRRLELAH